MDHKGDRINENGMTGHLDSTESKEANAMLKEVDLTELEQHAHSYRGCGVPSRLDRINTNHHQAAQLHIEIGASIGDWRDDISRHRLVYCFKRTG